MLRNRTPFNQSNRIKSINQSINQSIMIFNVSYTFLVAVLAFYLLSKQNVGCSQRAKFDIRKSTKQPLKFN